MINIDAIRQPYYNMAESLAKNKTSKEEQMALDNIKIEDLDNLETDLCFYEKVSLVFLLYGFESPACGLQKLIVLSSDKDQKTSLLSDWARSNRNQKWKETIIESLLIIQSFLVLKKLGLSVSQQSLTYLPHNLNVSLYVHPMLKTLYLMCENIENKTVALAEIMKREYDNAMLFNYNTKSHLEVYLLHWLCCGLIKLGDHENSIFLKTGSKSDTKNLQKALKIAELENLMDMLVVTENRLNKSAIETKSKKSLNVCTETIHTNLSSLGSDILANDADILVKEQKIKKERIIHNMDMNYKMNKRNAGVCLIINQRNFFREQNKYLQDKLPVEILDTRDGTDIDRDKLEQTFCLFGFRITALNNLTHAEIINVINEQANKISEKDCSFVVCILSHGQQGSVYGCNSIPVDIPDLEKAMVSKNLYGKPRFLVLQACQGTPKQKAINPNACGDLRVDGLQNGSHPEHCDILLAHSTVSGFASVRNTREGSWFIQTLCKCLIEYSKTKDVLSILTIVKNQVSNFRWLENCMVPETRTSLRKNFYLTIDEIQY